MALSPEDLECNTLYMDSNEHPRSTDLKLFLYNNNYLRENKDGNLELHYDNHKRLCDIKVAPLEVGDYVYVNEEGKTCAIEWKTLTDFRWSTNIHSDSVFRKTIDLIDSYDSPHLIIQGDKTQLKDHEEMNYEMTINSMSQSLNIREPRTQQLGFYHIIKLITNFDDGIGVPRKFYNRDYNEAIPLVYHLTKLGWKASASLCVNNNIHTNKEALKLLAMKPEDLTKYTGIGDKRANMIYNHMQNIKPYDFKNN